MADIIDDIINIPILQDLSPADLQLIAPFWSYSSLAASEILFNEGDVADAIYYAIEGELIIYKNNDGPIPVEIARVVPNQFFGEQAIIEDTTRSGTLQATKPTRLLVLSKSSFNKIVEDYPRIGAILLKGLAKYMSMQLRRTTGQFVDTVTPKE